MTIELNNLSSASGVSVQPSNKSGQAAAQLFSGTVEDSGVALRENQRAKDTPLLPAQDQADIEKQVQSLQDFGQLQGWTVNFSLEQDLDQVVIKVMDADTKSVIRQIPSEELIAIHKRIQALREGEVGASAKLGLLLDSEI